MIRARMRSASFAPPTGPAFDGAFFLRWTSCEHPHDRTGRICDLRSEPTALELSSLSAGQGHAVATPHPPRDYEGRQAGDDLAAL
jgi:hypothetical protein